ncbi:MAG: tRNA uridine-5-carboxymethylaminomethyl(34) synthesis GTPase MnmE, partial [Nitrospirales bacterium]|nr:tRNA uridine-5-carboxymethylaminomethyl(34) synthesis GTPase MnmE [Nitrospirales bacterium]
MNLDDTIVAISTPLGEGGIGIIRLSGGDAIAIADRLFLSLSGKKLSEAKSHTISHGFIVDPGSGERVDEVLVSVMRAPRTYTREDVVEINCHGGMLPLRTILQLVAHEGCRHATPGEFTQRAFLNGRIDLSQAEAVMDLIHAKTEKAEKLALSQLEGQLSEKIHDLRERITQVCVHVEAYIDFPEEEIALMVAEEMAKAMEAIGKELSVLSRGYDEGRLFREGVSAAIVGKPNVGKSSLLNSLSFWIRL